MIHEAATAQECPSLVFVLSNKRSRFAFPNRGKGDYFRLGHGTDVHVRKPQMVEGLRGKKIVHVAVGALHCLAVTDTGQVLTFTIRLLTRAHSWNTLTYCHGTVPDEYIYLVFRAHLTSAACFILCNSSPQAKCNNVSTSL